MVTRQTTHDRTPPATTRPATQFLSVGEGTIAYDETGTGPAVICVPSIGDVRAEYRFVKPLFVDHGLRVVTMDLRGHGESSTEFRDYSSAAIGADIVELARHVADGPVAVVATSKAGGSAVWAAAHAPDVFDRLVLISPFVRNHGNDDMMRHLMNLLLLRPWGAAFWTMYFPNFYPTRKPDDFDHYRANLKANLREPGRLQALKAMVNSPGDVTSELSKVTIPTMVVMGTKDPDFKDSVDEGQWIANALGGTAVPVDGAGHYPHAEMPEVVGPTLVAFLTSSELTA